MKLMPVLLTLGLCAVALAQTVVSADKQGKFDPKRDAAKDIASGIALAKKHDKR